MPYFLDSKPEEIGSKHLPTKAATKEIVEEVLDVADVAKTLAAPDLEVSVQPERDLASRSNTEGASVSKPAEVEKDRSAEAKEEIEKPVETEEPAVENTEPCFVMQLEDEQVTEGEGVKLKVKVDGIPKPEISWLKDGKPLRLSDRVKTYEEDDIIVLEITKTELEDEADYSCIARNAAGEAETVTELLVDGKYDKYQLNILHSLTLLSLLNHSLNVKSRTLSLIESC